MSINSTINSGGGTDWSKYTITTGTGNITDDNYVEVLNITGKGYLESALACSGDNASDIAHIKVTIDGVVKVATGSTYSGTKKVSGVISRNAVDNNSVYYYVIMADGVVAAINTFQGYPYTTDSNTGGLVIAPTFLFFNSSLKIEVKRSNNTAKSSYVVGVL